MSKILLMDWQRGKIPYFVAPPNTNDKENDEKNKNKEVNFIFYNISLMWNKI
jgi:ribosome biogenesis GTPase A